MFTPTVKSKYLNPLPALGGEQKLTQLPIAVIGFGCLSGEQALANTRLSIQQRFCRFAIVANGKKQCGHSPFTHNAGIGNGVSQLVHFTNKRN